MNKKKMNKNSDNKNKDKTSKKDEDVDDYQLTRAFDLIMALNLIDNKASE